jgi:threonyl-tRNA synthetase
MRDHRKLGRELGYFHSAPLIGAGLPLWLPDGAAARHAVESYLHELERRAGYRHVYSPPLAKREMYERSGHLPHFADEMFPGMRDGDGELFLRPSLCPHHAQVYASRGRSYRELPLRVGELGAMYRGERSGVLGGLSRVRAVSLNDGHIFCRPDQVAAEIARELNMLQRAHRAVGIEAARFRLSLPGEGGKYVRDLPWEHAAALLREGLAAAGLHAEEAPGEAAFYGPKIDVQIVDPAGREQTLSTVQVDFHQPQRFELSYVDAEGERQRPVMVHRSLLGSMERLMAHLLEVHDGALPAWCAPVQAVVLPVGGGQADAAREFAERAIAQGLRVEVRYDGSLGARIRQAVERRVPYQAVIGEREAASGGASLRGHDGEEALPYLINACQVPL